METRQIHELGLMGDCGSVHRSEVLRLQRTISSTQNLTGDLQGQEPGCKLIQVGNQIWYLRDLGPRFSDLSELESGKLLASESWAHDLATEDLLLSTQQWGTH